MGGRREVEGDGVFRNCPVLWCPRLFPRVFCAVGVASEVVGKAWLYANREKEKENTSRGYGIVSSLKLKI